MTVAATIESTGDIESICQNGDLAAGTNASIVFKAWDDAPPPYTVQVRDPDGKLVLDRVIRELPTGKPQSPPPVSFAVEQAGAYQIVIKQLYGKVGGQATLTVS